MDYELCCECDAETGRAGRGEDSLYVGDKGPYCEECWDEIPEEEREEMMVEHITDLQTRRVWALHPDTGNVVGAYLVSGHFGGRDAIRFEGFNAAHYLADDIAWEEIKCRD